MKQELLKYVWKWLTWFGGQSIITCYAHKFLGWIMNSLSNMKQPELRSNLMKPASCRKALVCFYRQCYDDNEMTDR